MAINHQDKRQGTPIKEIAKDYGGDLKAYYGQADAYFFTGLTACAGALGGILLGLAGGGATVGLTQSAITQDRTIEYGLENAYGYEAVSFDHDQYLLVNHDGQYRLYEDHFDHFDMELSQGDAYAAITRVVARLDRAIAAYESGDVTSIDFPEIGELIELSEAFNYSGEGITRVYDGVSIIQPSGEYSYVQQLQTVRGHWDEARQEIYAGHYGVDVEQLDYRLDNNDVNNIMNSGLIYGILAGIALGSAAPAIQSVSSTASRRKRAAHRSIKP
jgi:hypothetical protein